MYRMEAAEDFAIWSGEIFRNTCYEHLATLESDIFASLIQHILVGDC